MRMRRTNLTPGKYRGSRPVSVRLSLVGSNALSLSLLSTLVNFLPAVVLLQFGASNSKDAKSRILGFCTRGSSKVSCGSTWKYLSASRVKTDDS